MMIRKTPGWVIRESLASDESTYLDRRRFLGVVGAGVLAAGLELRAAEKTLPAGPYPPKRNDSYELGKPLTDEKVSSKYTIFDEFTTDREKVRDVARDFRITPWRVHIGGAVRKHQTIDVADLVRLLGIEERLYRHRCVEAWSMAVPWSGIPMAKFVELAQPLAKAKYVRMISFNDPSQAPGWYGSKRVFPYYEALTLAEATNELAFLATGIYGHPLPPHHGAPIRLVVPWKYGLKSIKSIVAFEFTQNQPDTFWNTLSPDNYSFHSNVDPEDTIPWSQHEETILGTEDTRATTKFNGYGKYVAHLYS